MSWLPAAMLGPQAFPGPGASGLMHRGLPASGTARSVTGQARLQLRRRRGGLARYSRGLRGPRYLTTGFPHRMAGPPGQGRPPRGVPGSDEQTPEHAQILHELDALHGAFLIIVSIPEPVP